MNVDYGTYELSNKERRNFFAIGYISAFSLCLLFYNSILLSLLCGFLVLFAFEKYSGYKAEKRRAFLLIQFKDMLYSLSASVATGRNMAKALAEAFENLKLMYKDETPLMGELRYMVKSISENRDNEEKLLIDFAGRSCLEDIRNFVDVYLACRETGGDMEKVIESTSEVIMDKMSIEREIKTLTAQKQFEGKIISIMPVLVILLLNVFSPDYLEVMYLTIQGRLIMTLALAGILFAYFLTIKYTRIEV